MWHAYLATASLLAILLTATGPASAQASKKLEEKTKGMEQGQQKSWQQVDEINNETDKTKGRYQQSQKQGSQAMHKSTSPLTKTRVGTATSGHKKTSPAKKVTAPKKK